MTSINDCQNSHNINKNERLICDDCKVCHTNIKTRLAEIRKDLDILDEKKNSGTKSLRYRRTLFLAGIMTGMFIVHKITLVYNSSAV